MTPQYVLSKSLGDCFRSETKEDPSWKKKTSVLATYVPGYHALVSTIKEQQCEIDNLGYAHEYAEPGYTNSGGKGILFANWNLFSKKAGDILEKMGFECEWSDEWTTCQDCGKAVRISPDSYSYQPSYVILNECELFCMECFDKESYLESIENDASMCCMRSVDPSEFGYELIEEGFESGLHPGMNDDPGKILDILQERGINRVIFRLSRSSQFYCNFEAWRKMEEADKEEEKGGN